jgi:fumarate reductase subunit D
MNNWTTFAIIAMMVMIVFVALLALVFALVLSKGQADPRRRFMTRLVGGLFGGTVGALIVIFTLFEEVWSPPDRIHFVLPDGFVHPSVYVIEDSSVSMEIQWHGTSMIPFMPRSATLVVPKTGVVRVKSFNTSDLVDVPHVSFSDGRIFSGASSRLAPDKIGTGSITGFTIAGTQGVAHEVETVEDLAKDILRRESQ